MRPFLDNGHELDLRQLALFLVMAERGSISAAAQTLGMAQATLSETLVRLEARIGQPLARRGMKGLTLTSSGALLVERGPELLAQAATLLAATRQSGAIQGSVSLAFSLGLSALVGVPLAETLRYEYPQIHLRVADGLSGDVMGYLESDAVEAAYVFEPLESHAYCSELIYEEAMYLIAAPDFLPPGIDPVAPGGATLPLSLLAKLPVVLSSTRHATRRVIDRACRLSGAKLNLMAEMDSHSQLLEMASRASAYTILPKSSALAQVLTGQLVLVPLQGGAFTRRCYLARKRSRPISAASLIVTDKVTTILRELSLRHGLDLRFRS